jgi:hypothetical protein
VNRKGMRISISMRIELWPLDCFVWKKALMGDVYVRLSLNLLSSKSEKRFLVNFQMMKATIPMTAIPPATDIPMIDPVPRLLLLLLPLLAGGGPWDGEDGSAEELELVIVTVTGRPFGFVEVETAVFWAGMGVGGAEDCWAADEAEDGVGDEEEEVEAAAEEDWEEDVEDVEDEDSVVEADWEVEDVVWGAPSSWARARTARSSTTSHEARTVFMAARRQGRTLEPWLCQCPTCPRCSTSTSACAAASPQSSTPALTGPVCFRMPFITPSQHQTPLSLPPLMML